jgi:DNA ligase-1
MQSSITRFFGGPPTAVQTSIKSHFGKAKKKKGDEADKGKEEEKQKEQVVAESKGAEKSGGELLEEEDVPVVAPSAKKRRLVKSKRRSVVDSSDEDEDEGEDDHGHQKAQMKLGTEKKPSGTANTPSTTKADVAIDGKGSQVEASDKGDRGSAAAGKKVAKKAADEEEEKEEEDDDDEGDEDEDEGGNDLDDNPVKAAPKSKPPPKSKQPPPACKSKSKSSSASKAVSVSSLSALVAEAGWKEGEPVPFLALCKLFERIESISGRLEIIELTRGFLLTVLALTPEDLATCVYLCCCKVAPPYEGKELGVGESILIKALSITTGRKESQVKKELESTEDLGVLAMKSRQRQNTLNFGQKPKNLLARDVLEKFRSLADLTGNKCQDKKVGVIQKLLVASREMEPKYIMRSLSGRLRIGLQDSTVVAALAAAFATREKVEDGGEGEEILLEAVSELPLPAQALVKAKGREEKIKATQELLRVAYSECPNYTILVQTLLSKPVHKVMETCHLTPGIPVHPMLARPLKEFADMLQRMKGQHFTCEYKYDGERAQIHMVESAEEGGTGQINVFSRNSENMTGKYPDIPPIIQRAAREGVRSFVLDSEAVAVDRSTNKLLPFQVLSTRKKKGEKLEDIKVPIIIEAFDLLFLNGECLVTRTLAERRRLLRENFQDIKGEFALALSMDFEENGDSEPVEAFLAKAVQDGTEGLMVKTLTENATYEPSKRSLNWLKLKKDYVSAGGGPADSFDLVPIGAYWGKGKRNGIFGAYLLACYNPEAEEYQTVCKIGTGFSEEQLNSFHALFQGLTMDNKPRYYRVSDELAQPDIWLQSEKVWEVKAADISISPVHTAGFGLVDNSKGISIRFPRLLRTRDDKAAENATTGAQIAEWYKEQDNVQDNAKDMEDEAEDWEL